MAWRAFIHLKNDDEMQGEELPNMGSAMHDLTMLVSAYTAGGRNVEDIQYAQVENLET